MIFRALFFCVLSVSLATGAKVVKLEKEFDLTRVSGKQGASLVGAGGASELEMLQRLAAGEISSSSLTAGGGGGGASVKLKPAQTDKKGGRHIRVQQELYGVPVFGKGLTVHQQGSGKGLKTSMTGKYVAGLQGAVGLFDSSFTDTTASNKLKEQKRQQQRKLRKERVKDVVVSDEKSQRIIHVEESGDGQVAANPAYLVNMLIFGNMSNGTSVASRPFTIIDAETGTVKLQWDGLTTADAVQLGYGYGGNKKTGRYKYGDDFDKLWVTEDRRKRWCTLENANVKTINYKSSGFNKDKAARFKCYYQKKKRVNGAYGPMNDAHYFGQAIFDMYNDWYGSAPLTQQLQLKVHYGFLYENAFWDGTAMYFGDGFSYFYPLTALDIVAHEVSHGVTEQNSQLIYAGQSGGNNEAFSDMAGKAAEYYVNGEVTDWSIGKSIIKSSDGALRYMDTPDADGRSIGHIDDFTEGMDVHYSSGVFNRVFYSLATTAGWDVKMAFDVFYTANVAYWQPDSDFYDAAEGALYAAEDLGYDTQALFDALAVVGIQ